MKNQKQYNEFLSDLKQVFNKHGFHNRAVKVQGQNRVEQQIKQHNGNWYVRSFHKETHGAIKFYEEFTQTQDIKLLWARMSSAVRSYELDPEAVARIAPDYCPVTGALIDYGYGYNQTTDNPYFRPGIDHKVAVSNGGKLLGDIDNIQIVSQFYNTIKNYGTSIDAIKWTYFELENMS